MYTYDLKIVRSNSSYMAQTTSHQIQAPKRAAAIQKFDKTGTQAHFAQHQKIHIRLKVMRQLLIR